MFDLKFTSSSSKPTKIRKRLAQSTTRDKNHTLLRAPLSEELKSKYGKNSIRVRVGDSVKLIKGEYSGVEGKIQKVFVNEGRLTIEGVTREKIAGGTTPIRIRSSTVLVTSLNLDDKFRRQKVEGIS